MKVLDRDTVMFETTGLQLYADSCIIGINQYLETYSGYADSFNPVYALNSNFPPTNRNFTIEERQELADYMIDLWNKFKEAK